MAEEIKYRGCEGGTMHVHRRLLDSDPNYARRLARIEEHAFRSSRAMGTMRPGCTRIPVVVHVIHKTAAQNVSQAQIDSQIAILNQDFRKKNADISTVPAAFSTLAGDARIEFKLADKDPDGNPTDGITRTQTNANSFDSSDKMKFSSSGGQDAWPADEYLNLWVCQLSGGLLGYAQFPGGPSNTDGVVVTHTGFGDTGTAAAPFDKGRTTTHEIGHWLNLRHIWGDDGTGCSGSDFVADTPNQGGSNVGKPSFPSVSCSNGPNGDMFMNYMDYVDDDTMVMFSEGQISRMQACLDGPRSAIGEAISCVGLAPKALPKDNPKEFSKDLPKDNPKEFSKDFPKDNPKEFSKDFPKDNPKEFSKDFPKDNPKEFSKDFPKDSPKDGIKEQPKEFSKETIKESPKDLVKDSPKDAPFDPGPGKSIFEPPVDFPTQPFQPVVNPTLTPITPVTPNVPFVLGTGAAPGLNPTGGREPDNTQVMESYRQILEQYSSLNQRGMLDAQGQAGWQQVWNAYQQLGGQ